MSIILKSPDDYQYDIHLWKTIEPSLSKEELEIDYFFCDNLNNSSFLCWRDSFTYVIDKCFKSGYVQDYLIV